MTTTASTISTYDKHADYFAQHFEQMLDLGKLDEFLSYLPKGSSILDAGCGSARDAAYFIKHGYAVLGIDASRGMLTKAQTLHPEVPTQLMNLTKIKLPDNQFDGIWAKASLLHISHTEINNVFDQFGRVLKTNGLLFIQTKAGEGIETKSVPNDEESIREFILFTQAEIQKFLEKAGFEIQKSCVFKSTVPSVKFGTQNWMDVFAIKK